MLFRRNQSKSDMIQPLFTSLICEIASPLFCSNGKFNIVDSYASLRGPCSLHFVAFWHANSFSLSNSLGTKTQKINNIFWFIRLKAGKLNLADYLLPNIEKLVQFCPFPERLQCLQLTSWRHSTYNHAITTM